MLSKLNNLFSRPASQGSSSSARGIGHDWLETDTIRIRQAETAHDYSQARKLLRAYANIMDVDLEIDGFSAELQRLPMIYRLPQGEFFIAGKGADAIGCVGWRRLDNHIAEVKRMFVLPQYGGQGIGRRMLDHLIEAVRRNNCTVLRLEVLHCSQAAIALYRRLGFREIEHYRAVALGELDYLSMQLDLCDA